MALPDQGVSSSGGTMNDESKPLAIIALQPEKQRSLIRQRSRAPAQCGSCVQGAHAPTALCAARRAAERCRDQRRSRRLHYRACA